MGGDNVVVDPVFRIGNVCYFNFIIGLCLQVEVSFERFYQALRLLQIDPVLYLLYQPVQLRVGTFRHLLTEMIKLELASGRCISNSICAADYLTMSTTS